MANQQGLEYPDGLIGVLFDDERGFVEKGCLKDDEDISDESTCTLIFDYDDWWEPTLCNRCKANIIAAKEAGEPS